MNYFNYISIFLLLLHCTKTKAQTNHPILDMEQLAQQISTSTTSSSQPVIAIMTKQCAVNYSGMNKEDEAKLRRFIHQEPHWVGYYLQA
jgi:hypothetical protein